MRRFALALVALVAFVAVALSVQTPPAVADVPEAPTMTIDTSELLIGAVADTHITTQTALRDFCRDASDLGPADLELVQLVLPYVTTVPEDTVSWPRVEPLLHPPSVLFNGIEVPLVEVSGDAHHWRPGRTTAVHTVWTPLGYWFEPVDHHAFNGA